jgi:hypothetical protein
MKKTLSFTIALAALLACAASASAAKPVKYQGKTSGGHKVTFKLVKGKKVVQFVTATPTQCIAIQGGGAPISGADLWNPPIYFLVNHDNLKWQGMAKPAFHYNEVTKNYEVSSKKLRNGTIRGKIRQQYSFLVPKYPIGTFVIYSCLGSATFSAKPVR